MRDQIGAFQIFSPSKGQIDKGVDIVSIIKTNQNKKRINTR